MRPFTPATSTHGKGRMAEEVGREWLEQQGYKLLANNYRTKVGELDVVADDAGTLCFVEIKARQSETYGPAVAAVSAHQQRRIARAASLYLLDSGWLGDCRFDVLAMDWQPEGWQFELVRGAFEAG